MHNDTKHRFDSVETCSKWRCKRPSSDPFQCMEVRPGHWERLAGKNSDDNVEMDDRQNAKED